MPAELRARRRHDLRAVDVQLAGARRRRRHRRHAAVRVPARDLPLRGERHPARRPHVPARRAEADGCCGARHGLVAQSPWRALRSPAAAARRRTTSRRDGRPPRPRHDDHDDGDTGDDAGPDGHDAALDVRATPAAHATGPRHTTPPSSSREHDRRAPSRRPRGPRRTHVRRAAKLGKPQTFRGDGDRVIGRLALERNAVVRWTVTGGGDVQRSAMPAAG